MIISTGAFLLVLVAAGTAMAAVEILQEDGVYVGTDDNLHSIIESADYVLLEFYAPCLSFLFYRTLYRCFLSFYCFLNATCSLFFFNQGVRTAKELWYAITLPVF
jgi:hypothetical protein